jgi:DNA-binding transcriptional ArsR family regulator
VAIDKVFEALSSATRRRILAYLGHADLTAGEIAERFEMSQPAISKHLSVLENAGLVWRKREGQFIRYGLEEDSLANTLNGFLGEVCPKSRVLRKESKEILHKGKASE